MAPVAAVHAVHAVHAVTGKIKTLKLTKTRISHPTAAMDKIAACATRARIHDFAVLLFGIGVGVLLYALLHDLIMSYFSPEPPVEECAVGCMCEPLPVYREKEEDDELAVP